MNWIGKVQSLLKYCSFDNENVIITDNLIIVPILNNDLIKDEYKDIYRYLGVCSGFLCDITFINLSLMLRFGDIIETYICADYKEFTLDNISDSQLGTYYNEIQLN